MDTNKLLGTRDIIQRPFPNKTIILCTILLPNKEQPLSFHLKLT